jgi:hypothetical protein
LDIAALHLFVVAALHLCEVLVVNASAIAVRPLLMSMGYTDLALLSLWFHTCHCSDCTALLLVVIAHPGGSALCVLHTLPQGCNIRACVEEQIDLHHKYNNFDGSASLSDTNS